MAESLFPVVEIASLSKPQKENDIRYKRSAAWDLEKGDFFRDGAGKVETAIGRDAYIVWCIKTSTTERYAHLAYPSSIGAELETAKAESSNDAAELLLERTITEALMINPRTEYVRDFLFEWNGDHLHLTFTVKGKDLEEFQIEL